jgi:hypothetical protein
MRRFSLLLGMVGMLMALLAPAASAASPYCGIRWGSLLKEDAAYTDGPLVGVRTGRHECFDRLVIDLKGPETGYYVKYVPGVGMDGSGAPVPLRGGAFLLIIAHAPDHDGNFNRSVPWRGGEEIANVGSYRTFREVAFAGSFEGQTTIGLGVRARLPFRVFTLPGPGNGSRLVIDVGHRW